MRMEAAGLEQGSVPPADTPIQIQSIRKVFVVLLWFPGSRPPLSSLNLTPRH